MSKPATNFMIIFFKSNHILFVPLPDVTMIEMKQIGGVQQWLEWIFADKKCLSLSFINEITKTPVIKVFNTDAINFIEIYENTSFDNLMPYIKSLNGHKLMSIEPNDIDPSFNGFLKDVNNQLKEHVEKERQNKKRNKKGDEKNET